MYISKLVIKNYRTFDDFTIELKPLTLIVGENNIGKSNLLDSIGLIFGQDVSYTKRRILEVSDFNYKEILRFKSQVLDFTIPIEDIILPEIFIEATLTGWDEDQESVIGEWYSNASFSEATLTYRFAPGPRFKRQEELQNQRNFIQKFINEHTQEVYDNLLPSAKLDLINFPISKYFYTIYGGSSSSTSANMYHLNQMKFELLDALRDACTELVASHNSRLLFRILNSKEEEKYQDLKGQLVGLQQAINDNETLQEIKAGISLQLDKISLTNDDTSNIVDLIFSLPDVSDLLKKISLIYGDNPIRIERNGTGRNNLLFISLVLSYVEDVTRGHSSYFRVVGLEEPESHLHPNLQDHLAHNIESLIKIEGKKEFRKDIQLLITSHSTHITTKIDFENTVVLYRDGDKIASHYVLDGFSDNALGRKQIKYLNKYLDAVNSNIFYSRKIILVEGISEKLLIPVFFERIMNHSTEKSSCCVVNVNGLAFSYFLEIIKNGFFQKCLVLTDRDSDTKAKDRADNLAEKYKGVSQIKVGITVDTTFEKDIINQNLVGPGRDLLLKVLQEVRPNSGKAYAEALQKKAIDTESFFALIEGYKSEFAYSLMLNLSDSESTTDGFVIPEYIIEGINFFQNEKHQVKT
ncbi:ATP-dependent nuclease [Flavobacterium collinsii]|uniref:ATP-dependent endonuclease n=1 Tax=Flavobacterium collinsii TaxID=1114861 RepID=A0A9W4X9X0_9FLAO|nr:AAA family ATPase [Flavobacterium collinsii]CAI2767118.1 ATP-dependent endonuclease [Flavobacterium collinsii]